MNHRNPSVTLTIGPPGAGKTTWARKQEQYERGRRLNRDDIRYALFGRYTGLTPGQEQQVTDIQFESAKALIERGEDVIIDDTNLNWRTREAWKRFSREVGASYRTRVFDVDADECYRRCVKRHLKGEEDRYIPREVIDSMRARLNDYISRGH